LLNRFLAGRWQGLGEDHTPLFWQDGAEKGVPCDIVGGCDFTKVGPLTYSDPRGVYYFSANVEVVVNAPPADPCCCIDDVTREVRDPTEIKWRKDWPDAPGPKPAENAAATVRDNYNKSVFGNQIYYRKKECKQWVIHDRPADAKVIGTVTEDGKTRLRLEQLETATFTKYFKIIVKYTASCPKKDEVVYFTLTLSNIDGVLIPATFNFKPYEPKGTREDPN